MFKLNKCLVFLEVDERMVMCYIITAYSAPKILGVLISRLSMKKKLHGLSPRANYTDRATAACRRSVCQLLRIEGATWLT
jgi:hypothetical protein